MAGGGIGKIDHNCAERLLKSHRQISLHASCAEIEIFYNLSMNRAHYFPDRASIYFVDSVYGNVQTIVHSVFTGINKTAVIEQLYLDKHKHFRGPLRLQLSSEEAKPVLVALRLNQIKVAISTSHQ